jgi:hypothetical protein
MKHIYILIAIVLVSTSLFGQCLPSGITLNSQTQIDNFPSDYPNCTKILGDLIISGGVANLDSLKQLTAIDGALGIMNTSTITNLNGLDNVTIIGKDINIQGNSSLVDLTGLEGLTTITGFVNSIISNNSSLTSLDGLNNLTYLGRGLYMTSNSSLASLTALSSVTSIGGNGAGITILDNDALASLSGIENIVSTTIQDLVVTHNQNLTECEVKSICDYIGISSNMASIDSNGTGCNTRMEVEDACNALLTIDELNDSNVKLQIYPNPASAKVNVYAAKKSQLKIYTLMGQVIQTEFLRVGINQINITQLPSGVYLFKSENGFAERIQIDN